MTSITQLLSPWPVTKHSVVLREQVPPHAHSITTSEYPEIMQHSNPASPNDNLPNSDPSSAPPGTMNSTESDGGENNGDGRKGYGKRELSTSKRAAQNRAAQVSSLGLGPDFLVPYRYGLLILSPVLCNHRCIRLIAVEPRSNFQDLVQSTNMIVFREHFDSARRATSRSLKNKSGIMPY